MRDAAEGLAQRLFENAPCMTPLADPDKGDEPMLLAGLHADIDAALGRGAVGGPARPAAAARITAGKAGWCLGQPHTRARRLARAPPSDSFVSPCHRD
ncbi:MAG: hypothetical protein R3E40_02655 [Rhodocyclaceae bacterium]